VHELKPRIEKLDKYFVTEGGFHPGIPSVLVRYVADKEQANHRSLVSADLYVFMQPDWKTMKFSDDTKKEFLQELNSMDDRVYSKGKWENQGWTAQRSFDFGGDIQTQTCVPIYLNELADLPAVAPTDSLQELGLYIAGFNPITIFLVMPLCMLVTWLFPKRSIQTMANFFCWSLQKFTSPPYGAVMALEAQSRTVSGTMESSSDTGRCSIRIAHSDTYLFTAVPAVACILQMLDCIAVSSGGSSNINAKPTSKKPYGWYRQGMFVDPERFLVDIERMGLEVTIKNQN